MATLKEQLAILQAAVDGKPIQFRRKYNSLSEWTNKNLMIDGEFNFIDIEYRVKPDPRVMFVVIDSIGQVMASGFDDAHGAEGHRDKWYPKSEVVKFVEVL